MDENVISLLLALMAPVVRVAADLRESLYRLLLLCAITPGASQGVKGGLTSSTDTFLCTSLRLFQNGVKDVCPAVQTISRQALLYLSHSSRRHTPFNNTQAFNSLMNNPNNPKNNADDQDEKQTKVRGRILLQDLVYDEEIDQDESNLNNSNNILSSSSTSLSTGPVVSFVSSSSSSSTSSSLSAISSHTSNSSLNPNHVHSSSITPVSESSRKKQKISSNSCVISSNLSNPSKPSSHNAISAPVNSIPVSNVSNIVNENENEKINEAMELDDSSDHVTSVSGSHGSPVGLSEKLNDDEDRRKSSISPEAMVAMGGVTRQEESRERKKEREVMLADLTWDDDNDDEASGAVSSVTTIQSKSGETSGEDASTHTGEPQPIEQV